MKCKLLYIGIDVWRATVYSRGNERESFSWET